MSDFNKAFVDVSSNGLQVIREQLPDVLNAFAREAHPIAPALQDAIFALNEIK